jgi:hypothetical protein
MTKVETEMVIRLLDKQQEYFKAKRTEAPDASQLLFESKRLEAAMRTYCNETIRGRPVTLFDNPNPETNGR